MHWPPAIEYSPGSQGLQIPSPGENVPALQFSQAVCPGLEVFPAAHGVHVPPALSVVAQTPLLIEEYVPASQSSQAVWLGFEVSPASHGVHTAAPWPRATLPGGHGSQVAAPTALKFPGEHMAQYERSLLGTRPAGHGSHSDEPVCATWPASHSSAQEGEASPLKVPAGHYPGRRP